MNGLKLEKETTHDLVRWTQVDGVTPHDGTPRSTEKHGGVVVRHLEIPSAAAAEDE